MTVIKTHTLSVIPTMIHKNNPTSTHSRLSGNLSPANLLAGLDETVTLSLSSGV